ncbi:tetratricopeptide repeat protein [Sphingopyxis sp. MSC1_008]|jgi:tetratricopeptide (TPR) repeat protein|uniref:tetratricopeptide repeat protein n=1 Tax=Sphingopyxis sp. MSC1_008 TaxID=2909265 RepID=UPI0020BDBAB8|nr:tetratricopeptide repeat protein [Sphingopyxis sp. MSC1_008]
MLRFIIAFLFLTISAASVAQAPPSPAAMAAQIAEEKARADKAEHDLAIREAADQLENAQTEQAYNRFEIWTGIMMGGFSVLVTLLVIVFGFRTEKAAGVAARQEVANAKGQIDALLTEAKRAAEAAAAAQAQAEATKVAVDDLLKQSNDATATAKANAEEAERHAERTRESAAIIDGLKANAADPNREPSQLTPAEEEIVKAAASGTKGTPETQWSVEEYKTRIGKAQYLDKNWPETLRLATLMVQTHGTDAEAGAFANNAVGDALFNLGRYRDAIAAYDATTSLLGPEPQTSHEQLALWAAHHKCVCLIEIGDPTAAEAALCKLLPTCEHIYGEKDENTLVARQVLAYAILDQGRASEAEAELRKLLPMSLRVNGSEHRNTLTTRLTLCRAVLQQGRAGETLGDLHELLQLREKLLGADHSHTYVARFVCARDTGNWRCPCSQSLARHDT